MNYGLDLHSFSLHFSMFFLHIVKIFGEKNIKKYKGEDVEILNPCHVSKYVCFCTVLAYIWKRFITISNA